MRFFYFEWIGSNMYLKTVGISAAMLWIWMANGLVLARSIDVKPQSQPQQTTAAKAVVYETGVGTADSADEAGDDHDAIEHHDLEHHDLEHHDLEQDAEDPVFSKAYALYQKHSYRKAVATLDLAIAAGVKSAEYCKLKAYSHVKLEDYRSALIAAQNAIALDPDDAEAHELKANSASFLDDIDSAVESYRRSLAINERNARVYNNYMTTLNDAGRWEETKAVYARFQSLQGREEIEGLDQYESDIHFYASLAYRHSGDRDTELALLGKAIALDPTFSGYFLNRGSAYSDRKDFTQALADYNTAIELDGKSAAAYFNRGSLFLEMAHYEKAIQDFLKAEKLGDNGWKLQLNLGNAYKGANKYREALAAYHEVIKLDPQNAQVKNNLAILYRLMGDSDRSAVSYREAQETAAERHIPFYNQAVDLARLSQFDKAIPLLVRALEINPDFVEAVNQLGICYVDTKQFALAEQTFSKAIAQHPEDRNLYVNRARAHVGLGGLASAEKDYLRALKISPDAVDLYSAMGNMFHSGGDRKKAGQYFALAEAAGDESKDYYVDYLAFLLDEKQAGKAVMLGEKAIKRYPREEKLIVNLANAYDEINQSRKAIAMLETLLKADPDNAVALNNLGNIYYTKEIDYVKAANYFQLSLKQDGSHIETYINLAGAYGALSRYDEAERTYTTVLGRFAEDYRGYYARASFNAGRGKYDRSAADFEKSFQLMDHTQASSLRTIGDKTSEFPLLKADAYQQMHRYAEAAVAYREYLVFNKTNPQAYTNHAYCLIETGDLSAAVAQLETAYGLRDDDTDTLIGLFAAHYLLNDRALIAKYRRLIERRLNTRVGPGTLDRLADSGYFYTEKFKQIWRAAVTI